jgi:hypothetical protein
VAIGGNRLQRTVPSLASECEVNDWRLPSLLPLPDPAAFRHKWHSDDRQSAPSQSGLEIMRSGTEWSRKMSIVGSFFHASAYRRVTRQL